MKLLNFGLYWCEANYAIYCVDDFGNLYTMAYLTGQAKVYFDGITE